MLTKYNFRTLLDYEPTEKYLDKMSAKGYILRDIGMYSYRFQKTDENPMKYRLFFIDKDNREKNPEIIQLFKDTGWDFLTTTKLYNLECIVFKSDITLDLEVYSDLESRKDMRKGIIKRVLTIGFLLRSLLSVIALIIQVFNLNHKEINLWYFLVLFLFLLITLDDWNRLRIYFKYKNN